MKRSRIGLDEIADLDTLAAAFHAAARAKRARDDVERFRSNLERELASLQRDLLSGAIVPGPFRRFRIRDPKPRVIHAPSFRDRVIHHAIMAHVGPELDRALVHDSYACRRGKGTLAAVLRAAAHAARHEWFVKMDVRSYFASIDHAVLLTLLARRFKEPGLLELLARIVRAHEDGPARGLPIGTLTSQYFANFYLSGLDHYLLERCDVRGFVRYMDDIVCWMPDQAGARAVRDAATAYLRDKLRLDLKAPTLVGRSRHGLSFCGYRILPGRLLLSRRRRHRYGVLRRRAERAWRAGAIDDLGLQAAYASALALTAHADARGSRRAELRRRPLEGALAAL
jgi:hypothetical protein